MIGKAKSISHGINDIRYITGESRNKKHPERIFHVGDNLLPPGLDATGIWDSMRLTLEKSKRVKNSVIRIEVSPAPEHTKDFTIDDWQRLWDDFTDEFDNIELLDKNGKTYSPKTALKGSKGTVWLHLESKSGIPHLHGAFCRIDERGNINNDHDIHLRAQRAAERVALKRGWTTAAEVRETNIGQVNRDCMDITLLKTMKFSTFVTAEMTVHDYINADNIKLEKYSHSMHRIVKLSLQPYFLEFVENNIDIKIGDCYTNVLIDYPTISVVLGHLWNNAIKYIYKGSSLDISFYCNENNLTTSIKMYSLKIENDEIEDIYTEGYSGKWAKMISKDGHGIGMFYIKHLIEMNGGYFSINAGVNVTNINGIPYANNEFLLSLPLDI